MKTLIIALSIMLLTSTAFANWVKDDGQYEIRPKYADLDPDDGFMDAGSVFNPWVVDTN